MTRPEQQAWIAFTNIKAELTGVVFTRSQAEELMLLILEHSPAHQAMRAKVVIPTSLSDSDRVVDYQTEVKDDSEGPGLVLFWVLAGAISGLGVGIFIGAVIR